MSNSVWSIMLIGPMAAGHTCIKIGSTWSRDEGLTENHSRLYAPLVTEFCRGKNVDRRF